MSESSRFDMMKGIKSRSKTQEAASKEQATEPIDKPEMVHFSSQLPPIVKKRLRQTAAQEERAICEVLTQALTEYFSRH